MEKFKKKRKNDKQRKEKFKMKTKKKKENYFNENSLYQKCKRMMIILLLMDMVKC